MAKSVSVNNPMSDLVVSESDSSGALYLGKYGAAKGPASRQVSVATGDGNMDDSVQITDADGAEVVKIPYRELYSFCVFTGEGSRKPAISFEHKPDEKAKSGRNHVRTPFVLLLPQRTLSPPQPDTRLRVACRKSGWRHKLPPSVLRS